MQRETSNDSFLDYGSVYHQPIDREHPELIHQTMVAITRRYVSQFYCFNCDTYLQVKSGIGVLLVSHTAEAADVQEFAMNRLIHIRPNIYFAVVSTTQKLEYDLYAESSYLLHITDFPSQYEFLAVLPRIEIQKILGYYYRIRTENYCFKGELHDFFELTYVDTGELETEVDGTLYHLKEKDLMIYGPGQFHTQYTDEEHRASYMTILFDMRNLTPVEREVWYDALINRVFHYDQKINTLLKTFVRESTTGIPYMNSLMLCLLTETIIRLLQGTYASPMAPASSTAHQSAMDELFDRMSYNFASDFIDEFGGNPFEDRYYDKVNYLDLNTSYTFAKHYTVFAEANNLLNQPLRYYQGRKDLTAQAEYYGVKLNVGFKVNF